MTVVAVQLSVVAIERELRISCVVKARVVPSSRAVAVLALLAALAIVRIVLRMAVKTHRLCLLKRLILVAIETSGLSVAANERKLRRIVIKFDVQPATR